MKKSTKIFWLFIGAISFSALMMLMMFMESSNKTPTYQLVKIDEKTYVVDTVFSYKDFKNDTLYQKNCLACHYNDNDYNIVLNHNLEVCKYKMKNDSIGFIFSYDSKNVTTDIDEIVYPDIWVLKDK